MPTLSLSSIPGLPIVLWSSLIIYVNQVWFLACGETACCLLGSGGHSGQWRMSASSQSFLPPQRLWLPKFPGLPESSCSCGLGIAVECGPLRAGFLPPTCSQLVHQGSWPCCRALAGGEGRVSALPGSWPSRERGWLYFKLLSGSAGTPWPSLPMDIVIHMDSEHVHSAHGAQQLLIYLQLRALPPSPFWHCPHGLILSFLV